MFFCGIESIFFYQQMQQVRSSVYIKPPFCFCRTIDLFFLTPDLLPWEPPTFIENIRKKVVDKFWPKEECSGHGQVTAGPPGTACQCDKFYTGNRRADMPLNK
jgi:hypothetical protein